MLMSRLEMTQTYPEAVEASASTDANQTQQRQLEEQLAIIIGSARNVAVAAEELLREFSQDGTLLRAAPSAIAMAPRLLAATEQQLQSVIAMLRKG